MITEKEQISHFIRTISESPNDKLQKYMYQAEVITPTKVVDSFRVCF